VTSILKKTALTLLAISLLLALVLFSSRFYLPAIISSLLKDQGLVVDSFVSDIPGKNSWTIQKADIRSALGSNLVGENIVLNYRWSEILGGKLISVNIKKLSYTPSIVNSGKKQTDAETTEDSLLENLPLPSEWLKNFPVKTIRIQNGQVLTQGSSDSKPTAGKSSIEFQVDISMDDAGLNIIGEAKLNDTSLQITGLMSNDNIFHLEILPTRKEHVSENSFIFDGSMQSKKILGRGMGKTSLIFLKTLFPDDSVVSKLDGTVAARIDLNLQLDKGELSSNSSLSFSGKLEHKDFFETLTITQDLKLEGNINSPTIVLSKGNTLAIDNLKIPASYEHLELILDSDITIANAIEKISTLRQDFDIDDIKTLLSEPAQLRFMSSNLTVSTDSTSPTSEINTALIIQGSSVTINGSLVIDDAVINIDSTINVTQLSPLLISIKPQSQLSVAQNDISNREIEEVTVQLSNELSLSFSQDNIEIDKTSKFLVQIDEREVMLSVSGKIQPLALQLTIKSDDLLVEQTPIGEIIANINVEQNDNSIDSNLTIDAFGTSIRGNSTFNVETLSGQFKVAIDDLSNTQQFLSQWCTEITSGSINTTGTFNLESGLSLDAQLTIKDFDIDALEFQIENLNYQGRWHYGDGLRSELGSITASQINPGILMENLDATLSYSDNLVTLPSLEATILQGKFGGKDLQWALNEDSNTIRLTLSDIDLAELVALAEYDMEISGKVKATLPIVIDSAGVQVVDGTIESLPPGGEIHIPINATAISGPQKEAFDALRNFHYTNLSGGISGFLALNPKGVLNSRLRLEGSNPDMGRPVVLNLSVEQNTYPLFQSLSIFSQIENFGQCKN